MLTHRPAPTVRNTSHLLSGTSVHFLDSPTPTDHSLLLFTTHDTIDLPIARTISPLRELSSALFERYDMDIWELFTRSRAVREEIFTPRYQLRRPRPMNKDRVAVTFWSDWRPVISLGVMVHVKRCIESTM
ncbi:hypothetical protein Tco_1182982 [Tanacetum coccineum]